MTDATPTDAQIVAELHAFLAEVDEAWKVTGDPVFHVKKMALRKVLTRAQIRADEAVKRFTVNGDEWFTVDL